MLKSHLLITITALVCVLFPSMSFSECSDSLFPDKHCLEEVPFDASLNGPPYPASGVTLLSRTALTDFAVGATSGTDIWGYVAPSGREYALMGLNNGSAFVEITDPVTPVIVEVILHADAGQSDIKTFGDYAYSVTEGGGGLQVIDMTGIDGGTVTLVNTVTLLGLDQAHNIAINEDSGFAYVCGAFTTQTEGGLFVLDLADPVNPVFAGAWSVPYVHDVQVVTYTSGAYAGKEIAFAYAGGVEDPTLRIVDVTNKGAIVQLSRAEYPNRAFAHQGWLSDDRKYVYLNDELDEINRFMPTTTYVIDVSDLTNPSFATSFSTGLPSTDHNLTLRGNILFEANYTSGLRIFDVSSPFLPQSLGYFDTFPGSDLPGFGGAWGIHADLPSGVVLVSDRNSGLFVLDVSAAITDVPTLPGGGRWAKLVLAGLLVLAALPVLRARLKG
jgi:choice-of-anchor B domain-containing protein